MLKHRFLISSLSGVLLTAGVIANALFNYATEFAGAQTLVYGLLVAFCGLYLVEFLLLQRFPQSLLVYLPLQTLIVGALLLIPPLLDTFAILFIAVLLQVTPVIRPRTSLIWAAVFAVVAGTTFLLDVGFPDALGQVFVYSAAYLLVVAFNINLLRLEEARSQLQAYVTQVEELAVMEERNRLARELHDSVTQTIFGMTFTAETARSKLARHPEQVPALLDRLLEQANSALAEMRSLVFELRPAPPAGEGLVAALQKHVDTFERQQGLAVELTVEGEERLSAAQAHGILRVAQEALNNVSKHAGVEQAQVNLTFAPDQVLLVVSDLGAGFDPGGLDGGEAHVGLQSMQERVEALHGQLFVESQPGQGTRVRAVIPLQGDGAHG
jgi:signal transduction histidine kinase